MERTIVWNNRKYIPIWPRGQMNSVEIEFVLKPECTREQEYWAYKTLSGLGVAFKSDCSVRGRNVGQYQEVVVSFRDDNYKRLINVLSVMRNYFTVNKSCGLHVHLDARDLDYEDAKDQFLRLADMDHQLAKLMPSWRSTTHWCKLDSYKSAEDDDRYYAVNWVSYDTRKSVEVRLGAGTFKESIVVPWVRLLNYLWDNTRITSLLDVKDPFLLSWMHKRSNQVKSNLFA